MLAQVPRRFASYSASGRKFFVGGNWKANGSHAQVQQWLSALNGGKVASSTEVAVAVPFPYLSEVRGKLRKDFSVASQVRSLTGEPRAAFRRDPEIQFLLHRTLGGGFRMRGKIPACAPHLSAAPA